MKLGLCNACKRHVRIDEADCPFCGAATDGLLVRPRVRPPRRSSRAAYLMLSATTSLLGASACDGEDQAPDDEKVAIPIYGAPIQPPPTDDNSMVDDMGTQPIAGGGGPVAVPVYGAPVTPNDGVPPVDGGMPDPQANDDMADMTAIPIYGAAPVPDDAPSD